MENKDISTDYHKFVRVGDQKWEIAEITIGITFLLEISIHYFLYREFSRSTRRKSIPPKVPTPKSQFNVSPSCINVLKNGSPLPSPSPTSLSPGRGGGCELWLPSASAILSQFLWFNSQIQIGNESVFFFSFSERNINFVGHLFKTDVAVKPWKQLHKEYGLAKFKFN